MKSYRLLSIAFVAVLTLGQGVAVADEVFVAGFDNGCFGAACAQAPPPPPAD